MNIMSSFDSVGFTDQFSEYFSHMKLITGWKDKKGKKDIDSVHKSIKTFSPTHLFIKKFLEINKEDYLLYDTMKNQVKI